MRLLMELYSRRIVNINVNIIVAGVLSILLTLVPVHLTYHFTDNPHVIVLITFVSDLVFDVAIYYALHWLANHWPGKGRPIDDGLEHAARPSFFKDATLVQFERAMLSPVLYAVFLGLQLYLLKSGMAREWAMVIGLATGILTARTLHTIWMLRPTHRQAATAVQSRPISPAPRPVESHKPSGAGTVG